MNYSKLPLRWQLKNIGFVLHNQTWGNVIAVTQCNIACILHPGLVSIPFYAILICSSTIVNLVYFLSLWQWPNLFAMGQGPGLLEGESAE